MNHDSLFVTLTCQRADEVRSLSFFHSEVNEVDLRMVSSRRGAVHLPEMGRPVRPSCDSAICEDDLGSENDVCNDKSQHGDKKVREETRV